MMNFSVPFSQILFDLRTIRRKWPRIRCRRLPEHDCARLLFLRPRPSTAGIVPNRAAAFGESSKSWPRGRANRGCDLVCRGALLFHARLFYRARRAVFVPLDIALGTAHAGGVHRTIWLGTVRRAGLLHARLWSRAGVLGKRRAAQKRKGGDDDKLLHGSLLHAPQIIR